MKRQLLAFAAAAMIATPAAAQDIKIGVILGYTGPIESLTKDMAAGAELAARAAAARTVPSCRRRACPHHP